MYKNKKIAIVIPAFNEEKFIATVIDKIPNYIDQICVIDDASKDGTFETARKKILPNNSRISIIRHEQNMGVGKAITSGYAYCLKCPIDIIAVMAGDNQMNPDQLPRLLDPLVIGEADYTIGDRTSKLKNMRGMSYWRRLGNWILKWLTRIASGNMTIHDPQNGYTAINRDILAQIDLNSLYPRYGYCNDIIIKLSVKKAKIKQIVMPAVYGEEKSKIKYWKYIPSLSWLLFKGFIWRIKVKMTNITASRENSQT
jgi:glycosyltransferase involved in cell wall biosynthesis